MKYPKALDKIITEFSKLPSIGPRTAKRLGFYLLTKPAEISQSFAQALLELHNNILICPKCFCLMDKDRCLYCDDLSRDHKKICVVEERENALTIENSSDFRGLYHVLEGALSPVDGLGPEQLRIKDLSKRVKEQEIEELIIATNPTIEGESAAHYLLQLFKDEPFKLTRLACGLPSGGDINYSNAPTITKAFAGRYELKSQN